MHGRETYYVLVALCLFFRILQYLMCVGFFSFQVGGMILVVQNSKVLDVQRKLFLESMSLSVSIFKPRTSSHQAIAEALDELQVRLFIL